MTNRTQIIPVKNNESSQLLDRFEKCGGVLEYFVFKCTSDVNEIERHRFIAIETIRAAVMQCNNFFSNAYQEHREEILKSLETQKSRLEANGTDCTGFIESRINPPVWEINMQIIEHDIPNHTSLEDFLGDDEIHISKNSQQIYGGNHAYLYAFFRPPHGLHSPRDKSECPPPKKPRDWKKDEPVVSTFFEESPPMCLEIYTSINEKIFGDMNKLSIYRWGTDCSKYFDAGKEWWGTFFWTVFSPQYDWYVGILGSATD